MRMRVAMLLDNAGSMAQDGKMSTMQTAAKNLVDQLSGLVLLAGGLDAQNRWWYSNASQIDTRRKKLRDDAEAASIARAASTRSVQTVWG
ncbi:hypothetical protein BKD09_23565 [Bradyrhizobium japonicum]|uniref:VWFA domain-containing protein n=2 Tax=Nitrobacteraceae TaxID=41294 RepID=A0A1L3FDC3_BRAJP|nr:hypothetical protein BKD09_23565 [Bradyrhizobium japonicum]